MLCLGSDALVAVVHLGFPAPERGILGGGSRAFLREALLTVGEAGLAPGQILLAAPELVVAGLPLAFAGRELSFGLGELLFPGGDCRVALCQLGRAAPGESLGLGELALSRTEVLLQRRGSRLRADKLVLEL